MEQVKIVIPSHKRAGQVLALKAVADCILCVEESQVAAYKRAYPKTEIVEHPDSVIGLAAKRQWMYEHFGDVVMLDDDVYAMQRLWSLPPKRTRMQPTEARDALLATAETARNMGAFLFGVCPEAHPRNCHPHDPLRLKGWINGACIGILKGSKLWWDEKVVALEDFWISGLNAHFHRYCFVDMRFGTANKHLSMAGGLADFRTGDTERDDFKYLKRAFGEAIQLRGAAPGRTKAKEWSRSLHVPF